MTQITIVGGGLAGLTAAIACAEGDAKVRLLEAHETLGGRARTDKGPYKTNFGPHAIYKDGPNWAWLAERDLIPPFARPPLSGIRFRHEGVSRRTPPLGAIPSVLRLRGREAPVDSDFRTWVAEHTDERTAAMLSSAGGVISFYHDPGELSAAFMWERIVRTLLSPPPCARYLIGGWVELIVSMERRARELGVEIETSHPVSKLPEGTPVILAVELSAAKELLGDESLKVLSGDVLCLDLGLSTRRGDPFLVSDLDEAGWIERYTAPDPSLAPEGAELVQSQIPIRPGESADQAAKRLERLLDVCLADWRERKLWHRRQIMQSRTGALDEPGHTWRDRPAIDRGQGVLLAGDMLAAPGLLSEVSWASAIKASQLALAQLKTNRPALKRVA